MFEDAARASVGDPIQIKDIAEIAAEAAALDASRS
jgi:hypothetical protein